MKNQIRSTCGSTNYATCINYESETNTKSELDVTDCLTIEDTTKDIYNQLEDINNESDLSALGNQCLAYTTVEGKIFVKNALLKMEEEICALKTRVTTLETTAICNLPIADCGIDTSCLALPCEEITTLGGLLNALIIKVCEV